MDHSDRAPWRNQAPVSDVRRFADPSLLTPGSARTGRRPCPPRISGKIHRTNRRRSSPRSAGRPDCLDMFFQPGIEAGLLRALPVVSRAAFQLGDLVAEVGVELLFAPDASAYKGVRTVGVRHPFGKPQSARILLLRIVY